MTMKFPTNKSVKVTVKEFVALIEALVATIENHVSYVDDDETEQIFADLVCNGIRKKDKLNVTTVAHMLDMTDIANMHLAPVIEAMFEVVPALKHYWRITKLNVQSLHIMKLATKDIKKLFDDMVKPPTHQSSTPFKSVQSTMTQHLNQESTKLINDSKSKSVDDPPNDAKSPSDYLEQDKNDDKFQLPKKTVPATIVQVSTPSRSKPNANIFAILNQESDEDISFSHSSTSDKSKSVISNNLKREEVNITSNVTNDNKDELTQLEYESITNLVHQNKQDEVSESELEQWILTKCEHIMEKKINNLLNVYDWDAMQSKIDTKINRKLNDAIQRVEKEVKDITNQAQLQVVTVINNQSLQNIQNNQTKLHEMQSSVQNLQKHMSDEIKQHKNHIVDISKDFNQQGKEYLEDHLSQRRTAFINQQSSFDNDLKSRKLAFDKQIEAALQQFDLDIKSRQLSMNTEIARLEQLTKSLQSNGTPSNPTNKSSSHQPISTTNDAQGSPPFVPPDEQGSPPFVPPFGTSMSDDESKKETESTFSPNTMVMVNSPDIHLPSATVLRHYHINDELFYDVLTNTRRISMESKYIFPLEPTVKPEDVRSMPNAAPNPFYSGHPDSADDSSTVQHFTMDDDVKYLPGHQNKPLMPNQFHVHGQPRERTINGTNMMRHASSWNLQWYDAKSDPKDFYESLKSRVEDYNILLLNYMELTKDKNIAAINNENCKNSDNAILEMSRSMYNLFMTYKKEWFKDNPKIDLLLHYEDNSDGLGFLKAILKDAHPNLRKKVDSETMDKPILSHYQTWFAYMKQYRKWVKFEAKSETKRSYTDIEHVSNILKQIRGIDVFQPAVEAIEEKVRKIDEKIIAFPEEYKLENIGLEIYELMRPEARTILPTYDPPIQGVIHRVNTRSNTRFNNKNATSHTRPEKRFHPSHAPSNAPSSSNGREWEDVICKACGLPGHDIDTHGCDQTAMKLKMEEYRRKNQIDKKTLMEKFEKHQKEKRMKRLANRKTRNKLRRQLRAAKLELDNDEEFPELKQFYVNAFRQENQDCNFNDPRANILHDVDAYDILDSEPEVESDQE